MADQPIDYLEKLNELQGQIGYNPGPINLIALLGLMGEAGEVLNETHPAIDFTIEEQDEARLTVLSKSIADAIDAAHTLDSQKKIFRSRVTTEKFSIETKDEVAFDKELADAFYYVLALARNRSLTINDLARLSYKKVQAKLKSNPQ